MAQPSPGGPGQDPDAEAAATAILAGFRNYRARFREVTRRAQGRFEQRDWTGVLGDATVRLDLYANVVQGVERGVRSRLGLRVRDAALWSRTKACYSGLIAG